MMKNIKNTQELAIKKSYIYKFEVPSKEKINDLEGVIENCGVGVVRYK